MEKRRALFKPVLGSLLAAIAAGAACWGSGPAQAQTPAASSTALVVPAPGTVRAGTWSTALVPVSGTVTGASESVAFSGQARVQSKLAPDPDFNRPSLVLSIDLSGVDGVGSASTAKYVISGPEIVERSLAASHQIDITFPFVKSTMGMFATRSGVASFALSFDVNTGAVTNAKGNVSTPAF
jgi:hypothetical protein